MSSSLLDSIVGSQNKPRIYIAYYIRNKQNPTDEPFHVSLLIRPHPLKKDKPRSIRFHAVNKVVPPTSVMPVAHQEWQYEILQDVIFQTTRLRGLLYLGKLPEGKSLQDVHETCEKVSVPQYDPSESQNSSEWRCTNWLSDALDALVRDGLIDPLPSTGEQIFKLGRQYVLDHGTQEGSGAVVCCDVTGQPYNYSK
ncbi:hypothetical protein C8Q75DRAFT_357810 [Abortiporus biennis]|nr:hypothetical protein C8Q75DRAFT_357810 [Abortiporus biennis]